MARPTKGIKKRLPACFTQAEQQIIQSHKIHGFASKSDLIRHLVDHARKNQFSQKQPKTPYKTTVGFKADALEMIEDFEGLGFASRDECIRGAVLFALSDGALGDPKKEAA